MAVSHAGLAAVDGCGVAVGVGLEVVGEVSVRVGGRERLPVRAQRRLVGVVGEEPDSERVATPNVQCRDFAFCSLLISDVSQSSNVLEHVSCGFPEDFRSYTRASYTQSHPLSKTRRRIANNRESCQLDVGAYRRYESSLKASTECASRSASNAIKRSPWNRSKASSAGPRRAAIVCPLSREGHGPFV